MIEFIYSSLSQLGFNHPLHPALTHIPMGMVMGSFFFGIAALRWPDKNFSRSAFHCSVLGLLFVIPTALAGMMDWQHSFAGRFETLIIIKMVLAAVLTTGLGLAVKMGRDKRPAKIMLLIYIVCLCAAIGLGFSGGQLLYG